jgi:hypothetical protein
MTCFFHVALIRATRDFAQSLVAPPTVTQNGGNFASVSVNNNGNLTFINGSVGANFLFPGTVTVSSGGALTGNNLALNPGGGQTGLNVNSSIQGFAATADLTKTTVTVGGGGTGVNVIATASGVATATLTDTVIDLTSAGGGSGLIANGLGAMLTLQGGGTNILSTGGGGIAAVTATNLGKVIVADDASANLTSAAGNVTALKASGGTVEMTGGSLTITGPVSGSGTNFGVQATGSSMVSLTGGTAVSVLNSGGRSSGVSASGSIVTLEDTSVNLTTPSFGSSENSAVMATSGAGVTMTVGSYRWTPCLVATSTWVWGLMAPGRCFRPTAPRSF